MEPRVSIIIPTKNGMPLFERCLDGVFAQATPWPYEVIVIDSGSHDETLACARARGAKTVEIPSSAFNHGATRNLALVSARGAFLVFLVQDAIPANESWLESLVSACEEDGIAGSYSRQTVRAESDPVTHFICHDSIPSDDRCAIKRLPPGKHLCDIAPSERLQLALFQNNSSCVKRDIFQEHQFARLPYGEDIEWGKRVVEAGYGIVYEPRSQVYHSHDRSPVYTLRRAYADHFQASELFDLQMVPSVTSAVRTTVALTLDALRFAAGRGLDSRAKAGFAFTAPQHVAGLVLGQYLGQRMQKHCGKDGWSAKIDRFLREGV